MGLIFIVRGHVACFHKQNHHVLEFFIASLDEKSSFPDRRFKNFVIWDHKFARDF